MLKIVPIFQKEAFNFVSTHHRHLPSPTGSVFQISAHSDKGLVGVCVVGRPSSRKNQDGLTLEVTRLCTDGTHNCCSFLYAASWRIAKELGYKRLITYIRADEKGTSLKASGWQIIGERKSNSWNSPTRPRIETASIINKILFEKRKV